ncbi:MAG: 16S rRNA (uracil(1498)-N(3))-methyltransferase [Magnetococcales bacterium]|nr:16S rRNA (uracil(1498)-N(3))-methyltransferase [Magnetococcales bacterium]
METSVIRVERVEGPEVAVLLTAEGREALRRWSYRRGDILTVVDASGAGFRARLLDDGQRVVPFEALPCSPEPRRERILWQALPDKERMLFILQKGVELGMTAILPLLTRHSAGMPEADKLVTWNRVVLAAAKQCRRAVLPRVLSPLPLSEAPGGDWGECHGWRLEVGGGVPHLHNLRRQRPEGGVILLVGPEGGWHPQERESLEEAGFRPASLGPRILRTETAALAGLAVLETCENLSGNVA